MSETNIDFDIILQNLSAEVMTDFSFTVSRKDGPHTQEIIEKVVQPVIGAGEVAYDDKVCKVSIVGIGMRSHAGVASTMFQALSDEGINIQMISTSEIKTSVIIADKYMELAVRALHRAFDLEQENGANAAVLDQ